MSVDAISDMATLIRNAITIKNPLVTLPYTKNNEIIAKILAKEGFINCICVTTMNTSNLNQNPPATQAPNRSLNTDQEHSTKNKETKYILSERDSIDRIPSTQDQTRDVSSVDKISNPISSATNLTTSDNKELSTFRTSSVKTGKKKKVIILALKYVGREKKTMIHTIKRVSKPSLRWYSQNPIPQSLGGLGIFIVSTSFGVITDKEAREKKLGGEILLEIW